MIRRIAILLDPKAGDGGGTAVDTNKPADETATQTPPADGVEGDPPEDADEPKEGDEPPAEPEPEPLKSNRDDPLLKALFADMAPDIKPVVEKPAADIKPVVDKPEDKPADKPADEKPADKPEDKPKRKKRVSITDLDPQPPVVPAPQPAREPERQTPPPTDPDAEYVKGLTDDQREELMEAEYAERLYPDKYGGRKKKLVDWYKSLDATATKLLATDANRNLEADDEFQNFLKTKPKMDSSHSKKVVREIANDEAERRVSQKVDPEIEAIKRKQKEIEFKPQLDDFMTKLDGAMEELITADKESVLAPAIVALKANPADPQFKLEKKILDEEKQTTGAMTREFVLFDRGLRTYDEKNPTHRRLLNFINEQGKAMAQAPDAVRVQNGKSFLPRDQYADAVRRDASAASKFWTFSSQDIIDMIGYQTKLNMETRLKARLKENEELGFTRAPKAGSATVPKTEIPANEIKPINPPKATPKISKGGAVKPAPAGEGIDVVSTLQLRR